MFFCAVIEIPGDTSVLEAVRILSEHNIRAAPVLNPEPGALADWQGRYLGVIDYSAIILWVLENAELASVALSAGLATAAGVGMGAVGAVGVPRRLPRLRRAHRRFLLRLLPFTFAPVNGWLKRLCAKKSFRMYYYHGLLCCFKIIFLWTVVVSFAAHQSLPVSMYPLARKKICTYIMN